MRKNFNQCGTRSVLAVALLAAMGQANAVPASNALPTGENVASGSASFNRSIANRLIVNQASDKLITDWNSFDVGRDARVSFVQPNSSSIALNRVTSGSPSEIFGALNANGQVFIANPNGIVFGAGSQVRVGGLVATTMEVQLDDMAAYSNGQASTNAIENHGTVITDAGNILLVGRHVVNSGRLKANGGDIVLANSERATLATRQGPYVYHTASFAGSVSNSGIIEATRLDNLGGRVELRSYSTQPGSKMDLSGKILISANTFIETNSLNISDLIINNDAAFNFGNARIDGVFDVLGQNTKLTFWGKYFLTDTGKINLKAVSPEFYGPNGPYLVVRNIEDLRKANTPGIYYEGIVLANDIDASSTRLWDNGAGFKPLGREGYGFNKVFDGFGHSIKNLRINRPTEKVGLFAYAENATISNVKLLNASISGYGAAGLVYNSKNSTISNNQVTGNIHAKIRVYDTFLPFADRASIAAGLVGINEGGWIQNNHVNVNVSSAGHADRTNVAPLGYPENQVAIAGIAGGLIGLNLGFIGANVGEVSHNTVAGTVTGQYKVGGLIGENTHIVLDNVSSADVVATTPLNPANPRGFIDVLIGRNTGAIFDNSGTGTVTIK